MSMLDDQVLVFALAKSEPLPLEYCFLGRYACHDEAGHHVVVDPVEDRDMTTA